MGDLGVSGLVEEISENKKPDSVGVGLGVWIWCGDFLRRRYAPSTIVAEPLRANGRA
jgi:hypothetical protein